VPDPVGVRDRLNAIRQTDLDGALEKGWRMDEGSKSKRWSARAALGVEIAVFPGIAQMAMV